MRRAFALGYGIVAYLGFVGVFVALADFVAQQGLLRGIDEGTRVAWAAALAVDLALLALFGISHSLLARPWCKRLWRWAIPTVLERSTYVLVANLALALVVWQWRPMPQAVWHVDVPAARATLWGIHLLGVVILVVATFQTDHFDLFGLRQVWLHARGRRYTPVPFQERGLYRRMRHPMMAGMLLWMWSAPTMSVGRLAFAAAMSGYIAIGIVLEERDLTRTLGAPYQAYRRRVRAVIPLRR